MQVFDVCINLSCICLQVYTRSVGLAGHT